MKNVTQLWFAIIYATTVLAGAALYNGYPLVTPDSGGYLSNAFSLNVSPHQPILYSLFLRLATLGLSLWPAVWVQALVLALLLTEVVKRCLPNLEPATSLPAISTAIALFTSAPWYVGQIMADAFTGSAVLCAFLLCHPWKISRFKLVLLSLTYLFCAAVHFSHLFMCAGLLVGTCIVSRTLPLRRKALLVSLVVASFLLIPTINFALRRGVFFERSSKDFLVGRLYETGVLEKVLNDVCPTVNYAFCREPKPLQGPINYFLWNPMSAHRRLPPGTRELDYPTFIRHAVMNYPFSLLWYSFTATASQMARIATGDSTGPLGPENGIYWGIHERFEKEFGTYTQARQEQDQIPWGFINFVQYVAVLGSIYWLWRKRGQLKEGSVPRAMKFFIAALVLNAFICGTLTGGFYRYQGRIIWLLPLAALMVLGGELTLSTEKRRYGLLPFSGLRRSQSH